MEMLLIGLLLVGPWAWAVWLFSVGAAWAVVLPKVRRVGQPVGGWAVACALLPLLTMGFVNYKLDD